MNRIDSSFAAEGQPFQSPLHLDFWQDANKEAMANMVIGLIGPTYSTSTWYRLYGVDIVNTGGDSYTNSAGAVFYNGEIYSVDAVYGAGRVMGAGIKMVEQTTATGSTTMVSGAVRDLNLVRKAITADDASFGGSTLWRPTNAINHLTSVFGLVGTSLSLTFEGDGFCEIYPSGSTFTFTLDGTRAIIGATQTVYMLIFGGVARNIVFATVSGQAILKTGNMTITNNSTLVIKYVGKNGVKDVWVAYQTTQQ